MVQLLSLDEELLLAVYAQECLALGVGSGDGRLHPVQHAFIPRLVWRVDGVGHGRGCVQPGFGLRRSRVCFRIQAFRDRIEQVGDADGIPYAEVPHRSVGLHVCLCAQAVLFCDFMAIYVIVVVVVMGNL